MAILNTTFQRFIGTSADQKPIDGVAAGAESLETDTGRRFHWDGTAWRTPEAADARVVERLDALLATGQQTNELLHLLIAHFG